MQQRAATKCKTCIKTGGCLQAAICNEMLMRTATVVQNVAGLVACFITLVMGV